MRIASSLSVIISAVCRCGLFAIVSRFPGILFIAPVFSELMPFYSSDIKPGNKAVSLPVVIFSLFLSAALLTGCAARKSYVQGLRAWNEGNPEKALKHFQAAVEKKPANTSFLRARDDCLNIILEEKWKEAQEAFDEENYGSAEAAVEYILDVDPANTLAWRLLQQIKRQRIKAGLLSEIERAWRQNDREAAERTLIELKRQFPDDQEVVELLEQYDRISRRNADFDRYTSGLEISVNFADALLSEVLRSLSEISGLNFILDHAVEDRYLSISLYNVSIEKIIDHVLTVCDLFSVPVDEKTRLILNDDPSNRRKYRQETMKIFYLQYAQSEEIVTLLTKMIRGASSVSNNNLNAVIVKGSPEKIIMAEKLIEANDVRNNEILLELEVLEVNRSRLRELGTRFGSYAVEGKITGHLGRQDGKYLTWHSLGSLSGKEFMITVPSIAYYFLKSDDLTRTLAQPKLRILDRNKAKLHIGEKVPIRIFTSVFRDTNEETVSYEYRDIGILMEITPVIHGTSEVTLNLKLEISSILSGSRDEQPSIGARTVETSLRLNNNEKQILAGLIRDNERTETAEIPVLGQIPLIGHFFSGRARSGQETDIVLTLNPHILHPAGDYAGKSSILWEGKPEESSSSLKDYETVKRSDLIRDRTARDASTMMDSFPSGSPDESEEQADSAETATPEPDQDETPQDGPSVPAKVYFSPATAQVMRGGEETVDLKIRDGYNVAGCPFHLVFDPDKINITEAAEGEFLGRDGVATSFITAIDNESGVLIVGLSRLGEQQNGMYGSGTLLTIKFKGIAPGYSDLVFKNENLLDPAAHQLPAAFQNGRVVIR